MTAPLWVILPVHDEETSLAAVLGEWLPALRSLGSGFRLLAIDDGSRDRTLAVLRAWERDHPELAVRTRPNRGHGATCIEGYREAVAAGAEWILQIDSDGQCDAGDLDRVWAPRHQADALFGLRWRRGDGLGRWLVSRVVSIVVLAASGRWVPDANVPFRLMRSTALAPVLERVPPEFTLANIFVALELTRKTRVAWIPIGFRDRLGGRSSFRIGRLARQALDLFRQIRAVERSRRFAC